MHKKLINTCIQAKSREHALEIIEFYLQFSKEDTHNYDGFGGLYYGNHLSVSEDDNELLHSDDSWGTVLTLEEAKELVKESEYPKVMWVSDELGFYDKRKRVVFMEKNGSYLAWGFGETLKDVMGVVDTCAWEYAKDIEEESEITEVTMDEVAEKFGIDVNNLKIKK